VRLFYLVTAGMLVFLLLFHVYVAVAPTLLIAIGMIVAAHSTPDSPSRLRRYLASKPLAYWIMTWFLFEMIVLTAVGTWFRGPGWSWVWPWRS
jgi:NADH:ubiquinone oxidoreductase subunit 6 (subunit J)